MGNLYFEIQADEPERAIAFYSKVFGWRFSRAGGTPVPYWRIEGDCGRGGMLQRPAARPPMECGTNAFCCSVQVGNFDSVAEQIIAAGGVVALPKFPIPGMCWQGYFLDTEGNVFGIFEVDERAGM